MEVIEVYFSLKVVSNNPNLLFFNQTQIKISDESHKHLQAQILCLELLKMLVTLA